MRASNCEQCGTFPAHEVVTGYGCGDGVVELLCAECEFPYTAEGVAECKRRIDMCSHLEPLSSGFCPDCESFVNLVPRLK